MRDLEATRVDAAEAAMRRRHRVQRAVGWAFAPVWVPAAALVLRFGFGYRIADAAAVRRDFARIRAASDAPLLVCANHLTLIDSFLIAWALAPSWSYVLDFDALPWNTPEETNFASNARSRALVYLAKCVPIRRGGSREDVAGVLDRIRYLLRRGETALLFPEGGRSRSGRVSVENAAWGVGRIVGSVEGCRVACVYMRGDRQHTYGDYPARGDVMRVSVSSLTPVSEARGARRSRDLAHQVLTRLAEMEREHFERHGAPAEGAGAVPEAAASRVPAAPAADDAASGGAPREREEVADGRQ